MMKKIPKMVDNKITISKDDALIIAELLSQYEDILAAIPLSRQLKKEKDRAGWYRHAFTVAAFSKEAVI